MWQENSSLQERLQRLELTRFKKEEEQEDIQGFQVQELAKVKHMVSIRFMKLLYHSIHKLFVSKLKVFVSSPVIFFR